MWMKPIVEQRKLVTCCRPPSLNDQWGVQCLFLIVPIVRMPRINHAMRVPIHWIIATSESGIPVENEIGRCHPMAEMSDLVLTVLHLLVGTPQALHRRPTAMVLAIYHHLEDDVTLELTTETQEIKALSEGCLEDSALHPTKMNFTGRTTGDVKDLKIRILHHLDIPMNEGDGRKIEVDVDTHRR